MDNKETAKVPIGWGDANITPLGTDDNTSSFGACEGGSEGWAG